MMLHAREDYNRIQDPAGLIPADEPVFLIRAQDVVGAQTVLAWAEFAERIGASADIVNMAREHAFKMIEWAKKKIPDVATVNDPLTVAPPATCNDSLQVGAVKESLTTAAPSQAVDFVAVSRISILRKVLSEAETLALCCMWEPCYSRRELTDMGRAMRERWAEARKADNDCATAHASQAAAGDWIGKQVAQAKAEHAAMPKWQQDCIRAEVDRAGEGEG